MPPEVRHGFLAATIAADLFDTCLVRAEHQLDDGHARIEYSATTDRPRYAEFGDSLDATG